MHIFSAFSLATLVDGAVSRRLPGGRAGIKVHGQPPPCAPKIAPSFFYRLAIDRGGDVVRAWVRLTWRAVFFRGMLQGQIVTGCFSFFFFFLGCVDEVSVDG